MERLIKAGIRAAPRTRILLTAAEAYPALEGAFLDARHEIWASFRVFDPATKLHSARAKAIGTTWFDLVQHVLARGVRLNLVIADFDPCARPDLHRGTWRSLRMLHAAAELAGPGARLTLRAALHPARTGILPRLLFWPVVARKLLHEAASLNDLDPGRRRAALRDMPGLARLMRHGVQGKCTPKLLGFPQLWPATHHQKLAVFDRRQLYIGGLDLDDRRFDTPEHRREGSDTWHDVQLMMEGPVVAEAQAHLESFADVVAGKADPPPQRRLLRTLARKRRFNLFRFGPHPVAQEILSGHEMLIRRSRKLIYLETQYFRDTGLARALARAARANPDLGLILILPAAPDDVAFEGADSLDARYGEFLQARALRIIGSAFGPRLFVGGAAQPRHAAPLPDGNGRDRMNGAPLVYIHAKVSVFDDTAAIVSSANLNGRSLHWDTEAGVFLHRREDAAALRERTMRHWLPRDAGPGFLSLDEGVAHWRALALSNARKPPDARKGFILPYDLRAAEEFGQAVPIVPEAMV